MTYIPDIYSGTILVETGTVLTIIEAFQMLNYGGMTVHGTLIIKGDLILK